MTRGKQHEAQGQQMLVTRGQGGWQDPSLGEDVSLPCLFFLFQEGWRDEEGMQKGCVDADAVGSGHLEEQVFGW